jgi:hypothetical protein
MRARALLPLLITLIFTAAGLAAIIDFNGKYQTLLLYKDPWCGTAIEIKKIRFNKYRIDWELITGEHTVVELVGRVEGNTIDFRKKTGAEGRDLYGYTYTLNDSNRLVVSLVTPTKKITCNFIRMKEEKK